MRRREHVNAVRHQGAAATIQICHPGKIAGSGTESARELNGHRVPGKCRRQQPERQLPEEIAEYAKTWMYGMTATGELVRVLPTTGEVELESKAPFNPTEVKERSRL